MSEGAEALRIGFIGLGNMGGPIASRLAGAGYPMRVYDVDAAAQRAPAGTVVAGSAAEAAEGADLVFLCLPSFAACEAVVTEITAVPRGAAIVVDTSTIGPNAAGILAPRLAEAGKAYVDAPVSGGVHRARDGDLTSMVAGDPAAIARSRTAMAAYSSNIRIVGDRPGQAQAMKLVNNYASVIAMLGASEAICYGLSQGLDMAAMLSVMNVSSGASFATQTLFPKHIATGAFDSAAPARIVGKDLQLFVSEAKKAGSAHRIGDQAAEIFERFVPLHRDEDWLRIFEFIRDCG